jgi:hypothetical protein
MKRSTASWTTAVAASALLALPVGSWAQQPTPSATPGQTTGAPAPRTGQTPGAEMKQGSANEHLRQAQSALADIPETSLTGTAKTRVAELKRHLSALEQAAQKPAAGSTAAKASWTSDAAAADRILSELLDPSSTTGSTTPAPTGTTGSTATAPKTTTSGKSSASMALDDTARTKLQEVRTHVTAFAAAMGAGASGATSTPKSPSASSDDASSQAGASAATPTRSTAGATEPAAAPAPAGTSGTTPAQAEPAPSPATPADPAASATPAQSPAQPPDATAATPSPTPSQQVDAETVKRHLTSARDTLSQLTQLPAAAQLTGDARTQVSQLISNFNELITTNVDWRSAYGKVQGNLTALVGEQRADESPATPTAGTAGAVGTAGTTSLDPEIRAKLIEFRSHLAEFAKAAGGGTPSASQAADPAAPASSAAGPASSATANPVASTAASPETAPSSTSSSSSPSSTSTTASSTTTTPAPAATTGSTAETPATAGTSGTGTPMPAASEQANKPSTSGRDSAQAAEGHRAAMKHIEAIEAILNGASPAGTSGSTASKTTKPGTLERAQIEEIRTHLAQLRKELEKSNR